MGLDEHDAVLASGPPGWYGKLSTLGDFAQRRLPAHCVQHCNAWLSALMHEIPSVLGNGWLELYLTAPVLRFAWAPGVIDMRWWFGVLMPSCDNVGRYFPLLITQSCTQPPVGRAGLENLERWYTQLEQAALHTLDDHASLESFEQVLSAAPAWPLETARLLPAPHDSGPWRALAVPQGLSIAHWMPMLAAGQMLEQLAGCTLWWPRADASAGPALHWGPGLPRSDEFAGMLRPRT